MAHTGRTRDEVTLQVRVGKEGYGENNRKEVVKIGKSFGSAIFSDLVC